MTLNGSALPVATVDSTRSFYRAPFAATPGTFTVRIAGTSAAGAAGSFQSDVDVLGAPAGPGWQPAGASGLRLWVPETASWPSPLVVERVTGNASGGPIPAGSGVRILAGPPGTAVPAGTRISFALPDGWDGAAVYARSGSGWSRLPAYSVSGNRIEAPVGRLGWFRFVPGAAAGPEPPAGMTVSGAAPNPFGAATAVSFALSREARVTVEVFDVRGARVRVLADRSFPAGEHRVSWDARDAAGRLTAPGVYFLRVKGGDAPVVRKLVRIGEEAPR